MATLDEDLKFTQGLRKVLIGKFVTEDKTTSDLDELNFVAKLLKDIDSQALTQMRINVEDKNAAAAVNSAEIIAEALGKLVPHAMKHEDGLYRNIGTAGDELGNREYVEGEQAIGVSVDNIELFRQRTQKGDE